MSLADERQTDRRQHTANSSRAKNSYFSVVFDLATENCPATS